MLTVCGIVMLQPNRLECNQEVMHLVTVGLQRWRSNAAQITSDWTMNLCVL